MSLSRPQPCRTPGPSGLCIPGCSVLGFSGPRVRKKQVCASLLPSFPLTNFSFTWKGKGSCDVVSWCPGFPRSEPREEGSGSYCPWLTPFPSYASSKPNRFCRSLSPHLQSSPSVSPHSFCLRPGFCGTSTEPSSPFPTLCPSLHLSSKLLPGESPQDFTSGSPPAL